MLSTTSDPFKLRRFVDAQDTIYAQVRKELKAARKVSHWMWFIFPQVAGLGLSSTAHHFAISGVQEALAYLAHPLLGARLRECTELVCAAPPGSTLEDIFGYPDHLKFRSSMTLFHAAAAEEPSFRHALDRFSAGVPDANTLHLLRDVSA